MPVNSVSQDEKSTVIEHADMTRLFDELELELKTLERDGRNLKADILRTLDKQKIADILRDIIDLPH